MKKIIGALIFIVSMVSAFAFPTLESVSGTYEMRLFGQKELYDVLTVSEDGSVEFSNAGKLATALCNASEVTATLVREYIEKNGTISEFMVLLLKCELGGNTSNFGVVTIQINEVAPSFTTMVRGLVWGGVPVRMTFTKVN